jgi:hypothetical protein
MILECEVTEEKAEKRLDWYRVSVVTAAWVLSVVGSLVVTAMVAVWMGAMARIVVECFWIGWGMGPR